MHVTHKNVDCEMSSHVDCISGISTSRSRIPAPLPLDMPLWTMSSKDFNMTDQKEVKIN